MSKIIVGVNGAAGRMGQRIIALAHEDHSLRVGAAHDTALLMSPNMSLVVNVLFALTKAAAKMLKDKDFDVEIVERHHRYKKDSPSGTAVHFAKIVQEVMGQSDVRHGREGLVGER